MVAVPTQDLPWDGQVTMSPQEPPVGVVPLDRTWTEETPVSLVWDTPETCRFLVVRHGLGRQTGEIRVVSCGEEEPNLETRVVYLLPDATQVIQEVAPRDWTNLWMVSRETLWSVRTDTGEVSPARVPVPRSDWRGAWRNNSTGTLNLLDSGGTLYEVLGSEPRVLVKLNLPEGARVYGDGVWSPASASSVVLVNDTRDRGVSIWEITNPETGDLTPLEESRNLPEDVQGLAVSDGRWLWVTSAVRVLKVNPLTGEVVDSWVTGHGGSMAGSLVLPPER